MRIFLTILGILGLAALVHLLQDPAALDSIGDSLRAIARPIYRPLVHAIVSPAFVYVASSLIIVSAIGIVVRYLKSVVTPEQKALRLASIEIAGLPGTKAGDWRGALANVAGVLTRRGVLVSTLTTYSEETANLGRPPARRFALFAEEDPWSPLNRRGSLMESLPSYYTTVGLILTFIGLVAALYFAARGFRSGDMAEARASIVQLLNASAFKFLTSVAALIGALMISIAHQVGQRRLRRATHELIAATDVHLQSARVTAVAEPNGLSEELRRLSDELVKTRTALAGLREGRPEAAQ